MDNFSPNGGTQYNPQPQPTDYSGQQNTPYASPSSVYDSSRHGDAPQYHYGINQPLIDQQYIDARRMYILARRKHIKDIKLLSSIIGLALILLLVFAVVFSFFLAIPSLRTLYLESFAFSTGSYVFYSVLVIGIPFLIASRLLKRHKAVPVIEYAKPRDTVKSVLLVLAGFSGCLAASYVTSVLRYIAEIVGIYSDYSAEEFPTSTFDVIIMFVASAIIPPLIEEYALRGVVMGSLRKYGNTFAILASAFIFGVFHGNAVQLPFAFMCGLILGYVVIATGSIWTGVAIHALTNGISCLSSAINFYFGEKAADTYYNVVFVGGIIIGILSLVLYLARYKNEKVLSEPGEGRELSVGTKFGKFLSTPVMVIAVLLFVIQALTSLSTTPAY